MSTQLQVLAKLELVPFFTKGDSVDETLAAIEKEALAFVPGDLSVKKNRDAIKAMVTKVTKSKTYLESNGKELASEYKAIPKAIDATRKKTKDFLTDLQTKVRLPLTEWEQEQERLEIEALAKAAADEILEQIADVWDWAHSFLNLFKFGEVMVIDHLADVQKKRDDAIAKEAADKATKEAEEKADAQIKATKDAAQKIIDDVKDKADATALKLKQDADDKATALALKVKIEACHEVGLMMNADFDRKAADKLLQDAADKKRADDKKIADDELVKKNKTAHKSKIRKQTKESLILCGLTEDQAKAVTLALSKGLIANCTMTY